MESDIILLNPVQFSAIILSKPSCASLSYITESHFRRQLKLVWFIVLQSLSLQDQVTYCFL